MDWGHPENIVWLLFIPVFIGLSAYVYRWRTHARRKFADPELISRIFKTKTSKSTLKTFLIMTGFTFGVLALMDPLYGEEEVQMKRDGTDIVYALDLSNSIYAEDVAPSRLEKAKKIISESVQRLGGDRIGLIVFAGDAYMISPLTTDYNSVLSYIESASPDIISNQGTNFYDVIETATEIFKAGTSAGKVLVLVSDGENNEGGLSKAENLAKKNKIKIISMGIGTQRGAPIPIDYGGFKEYKMNRYGETVISKLEEKELKSLAQATSGTYIYVDQTNMALNQLHNFINKQQKEESDSSSGLDKKHVFQWFLGLAFVFIFIDTLTSEHKLFNNKNR